MALKGRHQLTFSKMLRNISINTKLLDFPKKIYWKNIFMKSAPITLKKHFINFYKNYNNDKELREKYIKTFDELSDQTRSTFLKVYLKDDQIKVDVYRDDARGGKYN